MNDGLGDSRKLYLGKQRRDDPGTGEATIMKRFGILAAGLMLVLALAPTVDATTTWTARPVGHGLASLRVGSPSKLVLGLTGFRPGSIWTVSLRRGSCSSLGTLILSTKVTATSTGHLSKTVTLTTTQTRAGRLPLTLRFGTRCAVFSLPAVQAPAPGTFGDGTWRVGTTVQSGTYEAAGGPSCYWARLSGFGGTLDEIIANGLSSGSQIVTIAPTDAGFISQGCGTWHLTTDVPPTASPSPAPAACGAPEICIGTAVQVGNSTQTVEWAYAWAGDSTMQPQPGTIFFIAWLSGSIPLGAPQYTYTYGFADDHGQSWPAFGTRGRQPSIDLSSIVGGGSDVGYVTGQIPLAAVSGPLYLVFNGGIRVRIN